MPDSVIAGVPPLSTLQSFDRRMADITPYYIAPGLTKKNFYRENGLVILAAVVALFLLITLFLLQKGLLTAATPVVGGKYSPYGF